MMFTKSFRFFLLFMTPVFCFAQYQDSTLNTRPTVKAFIVPAALISYGLVSLINNSPVRRLDFDNKNEIREDHPRFAAHADNYMQFSPAVAVYALNLAGIKGKHSLLDATGLYVMSTAFMGVSVTSVKNITHRLRPDGSAYNSFPSGHTANAFMAAEFLHQEYKDLSPWYGVAGYTVATATGVLRMYNNKHWLSDVVAGAGFGIASTKLSYLLYPEVKKLFPGHRHLNYTLTPSYQQKTFGLYLNGKF